MMTPQTKGRSDTVRLLAACVVLLAATLAVYWQVTGFGFVNYDDEDYITGNRMVMRGLTWEGARWAFTTADQANWHPLTYLSLMTDITLGKASPHFLHTTNLILHLCNTLLLLLVLYVMTRSVWRSAFVAGLFALHPLHVESVAWIVERKDCLSTLFWMLTLLAYVYYVREPGRSRYALVLAAFALGLMAKPMLVTLPFTLLLLDFWPLGRLRDGEGGKTPWELLIEKIPMFGLSAAACVVTLWAQSAGGAIQALVSLPLGARLANAPVAVVQYVAKTLWPYGLSAFYPHPGITLPAWQVVGSLALSICITAIVIAKRKTAPYAVVGWMWFAITLLPVIGVIQVGNQAMADRYTYVPLIGLLMLVAWLPSMAPQEKGWIRLCQSGVALAVLIPLGLAAHTQVSYWRDSITLWSHALACNEKNAHAHRGLGKALRDEKRYDQAIREFRRALEINPNDADVHTSLGLCLYETGAPAEAEAELRAALEIDPTNVPAMHNLGILFSRQGRHPEAVEFFRKVLSRKPDRVPDLVGLGNSLLALHDPAAAIPVMKRVLQLDATGWDAANNLAWAYATYPDTAVRNPQEAVRLARLALKCEGADRPTVLDTLAAAYAAAGDFDRAVRASREAIDLSTRANQFGFAKDAATRLRLYEAHKAYVRPR